MSVGSLPPWLQVASHLGDFPHRLAQHSKAEFDFSPIPPITYPQLRDEMWCHRYYLRNLCDEARFPDWPIAEHVPFLQAMLAMWRAEVAQRPAALSTEEALETMEIARGG